MKVLVFGASGQVGSALLGLLGPAGIGADYPETDFCRVETLRAALEKHAPTHVINAAAYTQVDRAETEEALAQQINAEAPGFLARWCADRAIPFVHYSTDYVFSGEGRRAWREIDAPSPLNAYARTKLAGEQLVAAAGGKFLIFRTSWVYDATGKNFLKTILRLAAERETLRIVNDQWGAPTFAGDLARATLAALLRAQSRHAAFPSGIYHLCHTGETTWCEFAREIVARARAQGLPIQAKSVEGIPASEYPTPARRPTNSRLSTEKFARTFGFRLPDWKKGLADCMLALK